MMIKSVSKCLALMKDCWNPEFEPSVEDIVDYGWDVAIFSVCFLWRARTRGDFPVQSSTWQVEVTSGSTGSSRASQYMRVRSMCSLSRCPTCTWQCTVAQCNTFHEGRGMYFKFFIASPVAIYLLYLLGNYDVTYMCMSSYAKIQSLYRTLLRSENPQNHRLTYMYIHIQQI